MKLKIAIVAVGLAAIGIGTYAVIAKSCNDQDKVYKICSDQQSKYQADLATAAATAKLVLLEFGADW